MVLLIQMHQRTPHKSHQSQTEILRGKIFCCTYVELNNSFNHSNIDLIPDQGVAGSVGGRKGRKDHFNADVGKGSEEGGF